MTVQAFGRGRPEADGVADLGVRLRVRGPGGVWGQGQRGASEEGASWGGASWGAGEGGLGQAAGPLGGSELPVQEGYL